MSEQTELAHATHVKFTGMSLNALDMAVDIGDEMDLKVRARCSASGREARKDGEIRDVARMEVLEIEPGEITPAPEGDPTLPYDEDAEEIG